MEKVSTTMLNDDGDNYSCISAVYYNADASTFEDLVPEEKSTSSSFFDQLLAGASNIVATVVSFFKRIGDLIIQIF